MRIKRIFAVYFSPTNGTRSYVEAIAKELNADYHVINLTKPENRKKEYQFTSHDLLILGAPTYAGRLPVVEGGIFSCLHGDGTPAVFTVSYGNRAFEDALLEEKEICEANGFVGIAASAWIAPHTFSDMIAPNRPDDEDKRRITDFVNRLRLALEQKLPLAAALQVPGNHPYRELKSVPIYPEGNGLCTGCQTCEAVCPVGAIQKGDLKETDTKKCISCLACVKSCPSEARWVANPMFLAMVQKLEAGLVNRRMEPEFFF